MPRVHTVKKAAKAYPEVGIAKGDTYYWWEFRYGGLRRSKTYPRPAQLTQSDYLQQLYTIQDALGELRPDDSLPDAVADIAQQLRDLGQEQSDKRDGMPDQLQDGPTGELLQERADACEAAADELEGIDMDPPEGASDEELEQHWEDKLGEVQGVEVGG